MAKRNVIKGLENHFDDKWTPMVDLAGNEYINPEDIVQHILVIMQNNEWAFDPLMIAGECNLSLKQFADIFYLLPISTQEQMVTKWTSKLVKMGGKYPELLKSPVIRAVYDQKTLKMLPDSSEVDSDKIIFMQHTPKTKIKIDEAIDTIFEEIKPNED